MAVDVFRTTSAHAKASCVGDAQGVADHTGEAQADADHAGDAQVIVAHASSGTQGVAARVSGSSPTTRTSDAQAVVRKTAHRAAVRELTREEYTRLNFDEVRCTGCTPCCVSHAHFLYEKRVLWACQHKLKKRMDQKENPS